MGFSLSDMHPWGAAKRGWDSLSKGFGGGEDSQTQTTTNAPWAPQQPHLKFGFDEQRRLYDSGPSTVIPFSPETQQAMGMQTQMAQNSPTSGLLDATMRGDYLYGGQGFNAAYQAAADQIIPDVQSMFSRAGRTGSGLAQGEMAGRLGNAFAGQYGQERNNQMQALAMAPSVRYSDVDRLGQVGAQNEELAQQYANEPYQRLQQYQQGVSGNYGGTTTTTQPLYRNRLSGALGGAAAGSAFGPWGMAAGGLLGYAGS